MRSPMLVAHMRLIAARLAPRGWPDLLRQFALFASAYYAYRLVRGAVDGRAGAAFANARDVIDVERSLNLFIEPALHSWAEGTGPIIDSASWMYVNSHFAITTTALAFLYLFHNERFYFVRNMFMVSMGVALLGYLAFPTAPPRLMPEWGFRDSVADFTGIAADGATVDALFNPFAAVPSMHVAFALMIGATLTRLVRSSALRALWAVYPAVVSLVVVVTANHWWLDAALGAATAAFSAAVAHALLARARPHSWSFQPRAEAAV